ncbi:MAG: ATP-binding cassette domain-containing protein, partial [Clostridia bacterium]|nr:ATP-binding cassette domain-containing protein [Clostridia bacterium]
MIYRGMEKTEREILAREALALVGLSERETHFPSQLSGGEQQRVAIARAIVGKPQVLLADEPTGALDSKNSVNIMEIFTRLNKEQGLTIIQVTHDLGVAYYGQRIIFLADGEISKIETVSNEQRQMGEQSLDDGRINSEQAAGGISNG